MPMDSGFLFTSESVTEGHPDKIADQISDAVLDAALAGDPMSRVACETLLTTGLIVVAGEITTASTIDYATNETQEYMPMPIILAHKLSKKLSDVRHSGLLPYLRPDGKTQVTVRYDDAGRPVEIEKVLISTQHQDGVESKLPEALWEEVVLQTLPADLYDPDRLSGEFYVNPTGRFVIGGPVGDTGLTGRKIIVDTYGGFARHGGGAFSGKDPSKVDRSASYA